MKHLFKVILFFILSQSLATAQIKKGDVAPDFSIKDTSGAVVNLYQLKGNILIIDFWASWCGPCRAANPDLVNLYNEFHPQGLEIFSVSLDDKKEPWLKAIAKDKLAWRWHVSDLKGWESMPVMLYGINAVPTTLLLDKNMNVLLVTHDIKELQKKLKAVLNKN